MLFFSHLFLVATAPDLPYMKHIRILAVGRIKTSHWQAAAEHYAKRLSHSLRLEEVIVKDADAKLPLPIRRETETERLLKQLRPSDTLICLDETGKTYTSKQFATFLQGLCDTGKTPCFMIGGAYGLTESAVQSARHTLALGPMTFPHEMARVILLEQLYRAENILAGTGYHH